MEGTNWTTDVTGSCDSYLKTLNNRVAPVLHELGQCNPEERSQLINNLIRECRSECFTFEGCQPLFQKGAL